MSKEARIEVYVESIERPECDECSEHERDPVFATKVLEVACWYESHGQFAKFKLCDRCAPELEAAFRKLENDDE